MNPLLLHIVHLLRNTAIPYAQAGTLGGVVDTVGGGANLSAFGGADPVGLIIILSSQLVGLVDVVAGFFLVISGLRLVYRASEEQVEHSKNRIAASIVAIMLAHLTPILVDVIYGPNLGVLGFIFGTTRFESLTNISTGIGLANVEVCGIIRWIEVPIATIAVLVIIVSGLKAVVSYGSEEGVTNIKRTVLAVAAGGILILARIAIMSSLGLTMTCAGPAMPGSATTAPILAFALNLVNGLLAFLALVSVGIIVYAGIMMILTMGSEEVFGRMKSLIIRAAVGLTICLASYSIIFFVFGSI